jgi:hypothetical protein
LDESTGVLTPPAVTTVYEGRCRFRPIGGTVDVQARDDASSAAPQRYELKIPAGNNPQPGDVVEILKLHDPESRNTSLVDKSWRIGDVPLGTWRVHQLVRIEEAVRHG